MAGFASGQIPRIPLNLVLLKGVVIKGFEIRTFPQHAPEAARRDRRELMQLLAEGRIRPHVSAVYGLVVPAGPGTLRTDSPLFVGLLIGVIFIVGALTFFPHGSV